MLSALWTALRWIGHICWHVIRWSVAHPVAATLIGIGLAVTAHWIANQGSWGWADFLRPVLSWSLETAAGLFFWAGVIAWVIPGAKTTLEAGLTAIGFILGWIPSLGQVFGLPPLPPFHRDPGVQALRYIWQIP